MKNRNVSLTFTALFTALICVTAQISFATPTVPITLQVLGICLCAYTLSLKQSLAAVITYLLMGAVGLPVFSNFRGSVQILLGPTGGFLFGFILLALFCSLARNCKPHLSKIALSGIGLLLCHIFGVLQYSIVTGNGIFISFVSSSLPFILKDALLVLISYFMSNLILKRVKNFSL
ncbi:MAG: biotin transporter BioY [Clostridia bacterium]|nr:biotin transporter BioY [Clostridia bacterium]